MPFQTYQFEHQLQGFIPVFNYSASLNPPLTKTSTHHQQHLPSSFIASRSKGQGSRDPSGYPMIWLPSSSLGKPHIDLISC